MKEYKVAKDIFFGNNNKIIAPCTIQDSEDGRIKIITSGASFNFQGETALKILEELKKSI